MLRPVLLLLLLSGCDGCGPADWEAACHDTCAPLKGVTVAGQGNLCLCYYYKVNPYLLGQADHFPDGGINGVLLP